MTSALLLLLTSSCAKHTFTLKRDASAETPGSQADLAEVRSDVPRGDDVAARDAPLGTDAAARDSPPSEQARDAASGDATTIADGLRIDLGNAADVASDHRVAIDSPASPPDLPANRPEMPPVTPDAARPDLADVAPADPATLCEETGGALSTIHCRCPDADFYDRCGDRAGFYCQAGSCNEGDYVVKTCECPSGSCFYGRYGCVGAACTVGMDQTCNDNPALPVSRGRCGESGHCLCYGSAFNPLTGKCL